MSGADFVVVLVVLARFGVPLLIPRFPLPAIIAALVLDAVDGTILEVLTGSEPPGYQTYDKALDVFYLVIAYLSTIRNWRQMTAYRVSQFLLYYRLIGVAAFELSGARWLLLVFPNTFEYFFIWYEALRTRWNPLKFAVAHILIAAAAIWIFIKLPQEWWIHVAQLDFTDEVKANPVVWAVLFAVGLAILIPLAFRYKRYLGPPDWSLTFNVDTHLERRPDLGPPVIERVFTWVLLEKVVLVGLVSIIFSKLLTLEASALEIVVAVGVVVVVNALISSWLTRRGATWERVGVTFIVMSIVNFGVLVSYILLRSSFEAEFDSGEIFFLVLVFTLIVTLFDHYRPMGARLVGRTEDPVVAVAERAGRG